ncbi:copper radical oxidase [Amanita muscaria Koide BX008]|uniref:Copper radical oxidase n=1 Tax=Amanita muscaria (strain Koide BX008) TaxID=946122 RepID=A0A0C2TRU9_AMAMK|nr:copper radical oxidase [Amanita muscaria Koide BX008]
MSLIVSMFFALFYAICTLPLFTWLSFAHDPAWNGYTDAGSTSLAPFTPYYVAPGTKSYDSSSPLIMYTGKWTRIYSNEYVHQTLHRTAERGAAAIFTFFGTGIEWFGCTGKDYGNADVYIDGILVRTVNNRSPEEWKQQRLYWNYTLTSGKHTAKFVNRGLAMNVDALVVTLGEGSVVPQLGHLSSTNRSDLSQATLLATEISPVTRWELVQQGSTGVNAMQLAIISSTHAIIIDKVEHNPLTIEGHPAWAAIYDLNTHGVRPLKLGTNSFCAGGAFLRNGTLVNVGGNPVVDSHTSPGDFGDRDGRQAVRMIEPCDGTDCTILEDRNRIRMASPRWYPTVVRISDGSAMIIGGSKRGGWMNNDTVNNPTIEYFPSKDIHGSNGLPIHMPFFVDTLNANLFPIAFSLPNGRVFIAANQDAMMYDWKTNTEQRLPRIPNGVRVTYPMTGAGILLPLSPENNYEPEILICGGSTIDDKMASFAISSQDPASTQCQRIVLTHEGIQTGWQVEHMPEPRTMADAVLLPTGQVVIVNGARSGISGYGNCKDRVGESNADGPLLSPILYDPRAPNGKRFSTSGMPTSNIPRLYHSVASLTPLGIIMIAGSNPNLDRSEVKYGTEYRVEWLRPPYMSVTRPRIVDCPSKISFGQAFLLKYDWSTEVQDQDVKIALMDLGFVTHSNHANSRLVYLEFSLQGNNLLSSKGPPSGDVYPPGTGYLFLVIGGVPSVAAKVTIGDGQQPPINEAARENMLKSTTVD